MINGTASFNPESELNLLNFVVDRQRITAKYVCRKCCDRLKRRQKLRGDLENVDKQLQSLYKSLCSAHGFSLKLRFEAVAAKTSRKVLFKANSNEEEDETSNNLPASETETSIVVLQSSVKVDTETREAEELFSPDYSSNTIINAPYSSTPKCPKATRPKIVTVVVDGQSTSIRRTLANKVVVVDDQLH